MIIIAFSSLGIFAGIVSNYLSDLTLSLLVPSIVYFLSVIAMIKFVKGKRKRWMIYNSFVTFILVWIVVWIFLFNLG